MEEEKIKSILKNVERVEVPPYLRTRIEAQIKLTNEVKINDRWIVVTGLTVFLLVVTNIFLLENVMYNKQKLKINDFAQTLELNSSNQLYHE